MNCHTENFYYKIVEKGGDGKFRSLFHGTNGTRIMEKGVWLKAQIREYAKDGTGKTTYRSGYHVLSTLQECQDYLLRFKSRLDKLVIIKVEIGGDVWDKAHSPSDVLLCSKMKILEEV
jgi:hypothetical protein